ncbi:hypothetical protein [Spirosoma agri]|uniref:Uncharacterized protein n=1 Tax=Spirosoma agri TaxID=1987381 RepID=A0A6M0IK22_9BACT|nr:hypothetical protein [Spirosoma agri]NEU67731.1 hypothetical protein [Spirosoma agri]
MVHSLFRRTKNRGFQHGLARFFFSLFPVALPAMLVRVRIFEFTHNDFTVMVDLVIDARPASLGNGFSVRRFFTRT